jgi:hypothetical protein
VTAPGNEITLRDIYNEQLRMVTELSAMRAEQAALSARVDIQFTHGQRKMDDLDVRLRSVEQDLPERLADRLTSLESDRDKGRGSSGVMRWLLTAVIALLGGSVGTAAIALLSSLHR